MSEHLLITGPPASGKSRLALDRFLGAPASWLIVPTATMAEHVRNQLARANIPVRPAQIMTLAHFLEHHTGAPPAPPAALIHSLIQQSLHNLRLPRFEAVARYRGFHQAVSDLIDEAPEHVLPPDLRALRDAVESGLAARGFASRNARLIAAYENPGELPQRIVFDGFFSFRSAERKLIEALARTAAVAVTLPEPDQDLLRLGFAEQRLDASRRHPAIASFSTPTLDREVEEIARRILDEAARGRAFREIGVILRVREPYAPALQTTFSRFGIPARFYFANPLTQNPAVAYLSRIVRALLDGWDHAAVLAALRMPVSGIGATPDGDRFDFETRERLPASGLPLKEGPAFLAPLDAWRGERLTPLEWAAQLKKLRSIVPPPVIPEALDRTHVEIWRSTAWGLDSFSAALDQTAAILDPHAKLSLTQFWEHAELSLDLERPRPHDRRRNVVHVMDVFEARQWELPVAFVCGLTERHFPQYHHEDSLFNDAARRRAGLETSADRQRQERFLFELAITRATETTILSYSRFNEKGEEALRSLFLDSDAPACEERVRPAPKRRVETPPMPAIQSDTLLAELTKTHKTLAPTSIESFLQCPFQFFAQKTLRLRVRPAAPRDRFDVRLQGSILHRALAEAARTPLFRAVVFDEIFAEECRRARIPAGYRTEAVRLELARNFEAFLKDRQIAIGWPSRVEQDFNFALSPILSLRGRIDRLDIGPHDEALVIDYKYSAADKIRERVNDDASGNFVQGGLYLLAAEKFFHLEPAGMLFCGLRKQVVWDGWHAAIRGLEKIGESSTQARLRELMDAASAKTIAVFDSIASGNIAPRPADTDKCNWCDFRDICRIESIEIGRGAGAR